MLTKNRLLFSYLNQERKRFPVRGRLARSLKIIKSKLKVAAPSVVSKERTEKTRLQRACVFW